jgi:long-chain acyl-CoA synthetase
MEAHTEAAPGTGSRTMADIVALAARRDGDSPALRHKVGEEWRDVSYSELDTAVSEVGRGLLDLGVEPRSKVAIIAHTRPEWTYAQFGILTAGAVSVSVYQTNSAEECHYVLEHSESEVVFVEDAEQLEKIRRVRNRLPLLREVIVFDPPADAGVVDGAITLDDLRSRGRERDRAELDARTEAITPEDVCITIYTSGTTGPPKGCILTHGNYREVTTMAESQGALEPGEVVYLFLPLAHAFAKLVQFLALDLGGVIAYWEKDAQKIIPNLMEIRPTYFPSVPRIFEKIYTLATSAAEDPDRMRAAVQLGVQVRQLQDAGEEVPARLREPFEAAEEKLFANVRNLFGGRVRVCSTGAAPIALEILEFFYASGVPVMEGYGMTETATAATVNTPDAFRLGSVGRPLPGVDVEVAEDGELLVRGANIFQGYYKNEEATSETLVDGWLHTGDLGTVDDDGYVYIVGRKKDIIITAGGKNITPANLENGLKQSRWISQAVVVGDRRPYLVALITLDPDELAAFAAEHGLEPGEVAASEPMRAAVQEEVDRVNATVGPVEQVKRFVILPRDLSQETGELTPTLKVKRNVVGEVYAGEIEGLYGR